MTNMKVKCQLYNPNFVREKEKKKKKTWKFYFIWLN